MIPEYDDCPKAVLYINSLPMKGRTRSQVLEDKPVSKTLIYYFLAPFSKLELTSNISSHMMLMSSIGSCVKVSRLSHLKPALTTSYLSVWLAGH